MKQLIPAKKSHNPTNAIINRNFIIRVRQNPDDKTSKTILCSANTVSKHINDDKLKIKLFDKVLTSGRDKHTILIRKRLKIDFCSK